MPSIYYTAVGLEKNVTENRQRMEKREQTHKPITEVTVILMDRQVERANYVKYSKIWPIYHSRIKFKPAFDSTKINKTRL